MQEITLDHKFLEVRIAPLLLAVIAGIFSATLCGCRERAPSIKISDDRIVVRAKGILDTEFILGQKEALVVDVSLVRPWNATANAPWEEYYVDGIREKPDCSPIPGISIPGGFNACRSSAGLHLYAFEEQSILKLKSLSELVGMHVHFTLRPITNINHSGGGFKQRVNRHYLFEEAAALK